MLPSEARKHVLAEPPEASTVRLAQRGGPAPEGEARAPNPPRGRSPSTEPLESTAFTGATTSSGAARTPDSTHPRRRSAAKPEQLADASANRIVWHHFE
jgi:hypothetical protein